MRRGIAVVVSVAVALTACTGSGSSSSPPAAPSTSPSTPPSTSTESAGETAAATGRLAGFADCEDLLVHVQEQALAHVTGSGLPDRPDRQSTDDLEDDDRELDDAGAGAVGAGAFGANLQELGVEEPDLVATDGRVLYALADDALRVVDVSGDEPIELAAIEAARVGRGGGEFARTWDARLLLHEDVLLVLSTTFGVLPFADEQPTADVIPPAGGWARTTVVTLIDVADPAAPVVRERLAVDGATVATRRIDDVAVLAVSQPPVRLPWRRADRDDDAAQRAARDANHALVRASTADDWLPRYEHQTSAGERTGGALVTCDRMARPPAYAGLGTLVVLPIHLGGVGGPGDGARLLPDAGTVALLASGETAYVSADAVYVATQRWDDPDATDVHAFDLTDPGTVDHLGSGTVPGTVYGQWAMSEHAGVLRVASTLGEPSWAEPTDTESFVTTLRLQDGALVQVGQVGGLGPDEQIVAARFVDGVGYVLTAFASDPLITLDLSDPADPRVLGQLTLPGATTYLHLLDNDLLFGVGQTLPQGDDEGSESALQLSLFDVADLVRPHRLEAWTADDAHSEVEDDHRALLHWQPTGLLVLPVAQVTYYPGSWQPMELDPSALALGATRTGGLEELGRFTHTDLVPELTDGRADELDHAARWELVAPTTIRRARVLDDRLVTVSDAGVKVHDLATLEDLGGVRFGG
jgi:hypothetical protein